MPRVRKYLSWRELFVANGIMPTANDAERMVRYAKGKALIIKKLWRRSDEAAYQEAILELQEYLEV